MLPGPSARPGGLHEAKRALRARVLAERNALAAAVHSDQSARIAARLAGLDSFRQAEVVLLTLPFGSEWDTRPLAVAALSQRKTLAIPRVDAGAKMLVLHAVTDLARDIAPGFRAIPEPLAATRVVAPEAIDWILVPGVAFDASGGRLGYGGGYYDRLLPLCRAGVPRVAGAFELQLLDRVPAAPHDAHIDAIATPDRFVIARRP
jgi:5-formyltetrahydrofolate cyclo-ligase